MNELIDCAEALLKQYFSMDCGIQSVDVLSAPERRNLILRLHLAADSKSTPSSIILKQSLGTEEDEEETDARFARDWAGLEFLSQFPESEPLTPKFYGGSPALRFILQEDLGHQHISLVDSLTSSNTIQAEAALARFMRSLGRMHAASFQQLTQYQRILGRINPGGCDEFATASSIRKDLIERLNAATLALGLTVSQSLSDEVTMITEHVVLPGAFTVLTHGDICPDNVFDHPAQDQDLQFIDFEWSWLRSALLDGTYLRMSFPTCWCARILPEAVIQSLEAIYRQELVKTIPAAQDDALYQEAYVYACAFWVLQQTVHFIPGVIEKERIGPSGPLPPDSLWVTAENTVRPRVLARLKAFIRISSQANQLPHLNEMACAMLKILERIWAQTHPLEFYPAFRDY
ncbi:MAG: hypothetical protein J0I93_08840 [Legionella sp.]|nr:hypothetical protein [Legionella sp.]